METAVEQTLVALGLEVAEARERLANATEATKTARENKERAEQALLDAMEYQGVKSCKVPGMGSLTMSTKTSATYTLEHLAEVMEWLKGLGHGDVIRPHVPSPTFTSIVKEAIEAGHQIPEAIKVFQEVSLSFRKE